MYGMMSVWVALESGLHAACPATPEQLTGSADQVSAAFLAMDDDAFNRALAELNEEVGCLSAVPYGPQVAATHLAYGLVAYHAQDRDVALAHFQSMAQVQGWSLPPAFVERPPVSDWMREAARRPPGPGIGYALKPGYSLIVDGESSAELPTGRAAIVLIRGPEGVVWSGVLRPGTLPPPDTRWLPPTFVDATPAPSGADAVAQRPTEPSAMAVHAARWPWLGAGVAASGALTLWVGFANRNADYRIVMDAINDGASEAEIGLGLEDVRSLERTRNAWLAGAGTVTGAAIGLGVVGLVLGQQTSADAAVSVGPAGVMLRW